MANGGNSHQRKMARKAETRLAESVTELVLEKFGRKEEQRKEAEVSKARILWRKAREFWLSTPVWGALGVLAGLLLSQFSRVLAFALVGFAMWAEFLRIGFFNTRITKWFGNIAAGIVIAAILVGIWKVAGTPKEAPTVDQEVKAFAKNFPWLSEPPRVENKTIVTQPKPDHTHIMVLDPSESTDYPYWPLHTGRTYLNYEFVNSGTSMASDTSFWAEPKVLDIPEMHDDAYVPKEYRKLANQKRKALGQGSSLLPGGDPRYRTIVADLSEDDIKKIMNRESALCVFGRIWWQDDSGCYTSDSAYCLEHEINGHVWHHVVEQENKRGCH